MVSIREFLYLDDLTVDFEGLSIESRNVLVLVVLVLVLVVFIVFGVIVVSVVLPGVFLLTTIVSFISAVRLTVSVPPSLLVGTDAGTANQRDRDYATTTEEDFSTLHTLYINQNIYSFCPYSAHLYFLESGH